MVDNIAQCVTTYSHFLASWMIAPLAFVFFIILLATFVGYFAMKRSIFGAVIFQLISMVILLFLWEGIMLLFI